MILRLSVLFDSLFFFFVLVMRKVEKKIVVDFIVITGGNQNSILPWFHVRTYPFNEIQIKTTD